MLWSATKTALPALLLSTAVSVVVADSDDSGSPSAYRLHHRIFHPAFERPLFAPRGLVHLTGTLGPSVEPAKTLQEDLNGFAAALRAGMDQGERTDDVLYQFALERPGDANDRAWDVSSVRAVRSSATKVVFPTKKNFSHFFFRVFNFSAI
jgi:hypothetical protein